MNIEQLRQLDVTVVCSLLGLERDTTDHKQFKTDGFRIAVDGLKWVDHEVKKGGGGEIDLIMHVQGLAFMKSCNFLSSVSGELDTVTHTTHTKETNKKATKPPQADNSKLPLVTAYLTNKRHLNPNLVQWCIDRGMIYADSRANCVFRYGANGSELRGMGSTSNPQATRLSGFKLRFYQYSPSIVNTVQIHRWLKYSSIIARAPFQHSKPHFLSVL